MDSSKTVSSKIDIKQLNSMIIEQFIKANAIDENHTIEFNQIDITCPPKLKLMLVNEFVKLGYVNVVSKRFYFDKRKYDKERRKVRAIYIGTIIFPFIIGLLLMIYKL